MPGDTVTYQEVFGAEPGQEIQESHGMTWRPCPAVLALRGLLGSFSDVFPNRKLGGRSGYWNEFNRHHAGLAVDIMLSPHVDAEVRLGENLFVLFNRHKQIMQWRGMLYQHVSINFAGNVGNYRPNDHNNHIHIDWHESRNVTWFSPIEQIPWRRSSGAHRGEVQMLRPKQHPRIASSIRWTQQAMTDFRQNQTLQDDLTDLINRHRQGELQRVDLAQELGLVR